MDLRVVRTRRHIQEACLALRAQEPLERITVKELAARAEINKATFYLHYRDIYDLSDRMEEEIIAAVMAGITHPENLIFRPSEAMRELVSAYQRHQKSIDVVFSGSQRGNLVKRIDSSVRAMIYGSYPHWRENVQVNIILNYCIYGSYYACMENLGQGVDAVLPTLCRITERINELFPAPDGETQQRRRGPETPPTETAGSQA